MQNCPAVCRAQHKLLVLNHQACAAKSRAAVTAQKAATKRRQRTCANGSGGSLDHSLQESVRGCPPSQSSHVPPETQQRLRCVPV